MRAAHHRFNASRSAATAALSIFSRSRSAQPARDNASSRSAAPAVFAGPAFVASRAPDTPAINLFTTASSSGDCATWAPPLTSDSARLRTKSTLKRKMSSWSCVAERSTDDAASTSNRRTRKRLTCGAMRVSKLDTTTGDRGASGAARYASHSDQNTASVARTSSQNRS